MHTADEGFVMDNAAGAGNLSGFLMVVVRVV